MVAVQVKAGSDEFTTVEKHLKATAQNMVNSIVKVFVFFILSIYAVNEIGCPEKWGYWCWRAIIKGPVPMPLGIRWWMKKG